MSTSSSDSDAAEVVKNLHAVIIKSDSADQENSKKYVYKRKLGDLVFDANFETGNLGLVEQIDQYDYDLMVRPDVANPRARLWFNFIVSNQLPNQCVIFTFVNFSESVPLFHEGFTPVVRSKSNPNWVHLHEDQVFYYRSVNHGNRYVLSLAFRFSTYDNMHQFALCYPYGYTNLVSFIQRWSVLLARADHKKLKSTVIVAQTNQKHERKLNSGPHPEELRTRSSQGFYSSTPSNECDKIGTDTNFQIEQSTTSILSKSIYLLSLKGSRDDQLCKPKVIIIGRSSGNLDSVASFVCQGSMDYLLSDNLIARAARHYIDFEIIPMIDPDSVCAGNTKTDIMGQSNLTPKIINANPGIYSNYITAREYVGEICEISSNRVIILELRVNMNLIGSRIIGKYYRDSFRMERHLSLPRLLARFTDDFYLENCEFDTRSQDDSTIFDLHSGRRSNVDNYRLEISPFAYYKRSLAERSYEEYDQMKYLSLGKAIIFSMLEFLRPKDTVLPYGVAAILDAFHPKSDDIDDLLLKLER